MVEREGPHTRLIAYGTIVLVGLTYLILAATVHWAPFSPNPGPTPTSSPPTAAPPGKPTQPSAGWIAQLASIPVSAGSAQLQQALNEIRTEIPRAQYLNSSNYASLNPGYWVIYYMGPFNDGNQALYYCASHGRTNRNQCVGRFLSHDAQDRSYICFPPAGSQTAGCFRPETTGFENGSSFSTTSPIAIR